MMRERIVIDPKIQHGKPVIKGTRVPVARIIEGLAGGMEIKEICDEYGLTKEDVQAALTFAGKLINGEVYRALPKSA